MTIFLAKLKTELLKFLKASANESFWIKTDTEKKINKIKRATRAYLKAGFRPELRYDLMARFPSAIWEETNEGAMRGNSVTFGG